MTSTNAPRTKLLSLLFAVGILLTIALIGIATSAAGRLAGDVGPAGNYVVAGIFFLVGLHLLDVIPVPWAGPGRIIMKRRGLPAAFPLGLILGIALGPCTLFWTGSR